MTKPHVYWPIIILVVASTLIYTFVGFQKHQHFQTFAWDTSVFDQELYFVKDLKAPYSSLVKINGLGDHFQITFLVVGAIFYRVYSNPLTLFFMQALITSLSAIPLFLISKHLLGGLKISNFSKNFLSLSLVFAYLFSVSIQGMLTDEFHNEPLVTLPLIYIFYFLIKKNWIGYWLSLIVVLLTKEIYGLICIPLGLYIFLTDKNFKQAVLTIIVGISVFFLLVYSVMPSIAGTNKYLHFAKGNQPDEVLAKIIQNPTILISEFFNQSKKRETIFYSLVSFGFLPLLSPQNLLLPAASLAVRFFDYTTPRMYEFNNHYAAPFSPLLAVSTSFGLFQLIRLLQFKGFNLEISSKQIALYLISITFIQSYLFHGPLNSLLKPDFYKFSAWEQDAHELISKTPKSEVISSQNSLLPHLSQRNNFYLLPEISDAKYIAVDLSQGPNKFAPFQDSKEIEKIINKLIQENKFWIVFQKNKAILLQKS